MQAVAEKVGSINENKKLIIYLACFATWPQPDFICTLFLSWQKKGTSLFDDESSMKGPS